MRREKNIKSSVVACRFPSCGPFVRVAYRPAAAVPSELPDCVLFSIRLSSRYRSPSFVVGISPPVSKLLVLSPRLPYRWAGRGVGRDGGRDGGRNRRGAEEKPIAEPSDTRVALRSQPTPACQSMHFPKPSSEHVLLEPVASRAISAFQCRVSGVIQLLISFFFFNDTVV